MNRPQTNSCRRCAARTAAPTTRCLTSVLSGGAAGHVPAIGSCAGRCQAFNLIVSLSCSALTCQASLAGPRRAVRCLAAALFLPCCVSQGMRAQTAAGRDVHACRHALTSLGVLADLCRLQDHCGGGARQPTAAGPAAGASQRAAGSRADALTGGAAGAHASACLLTVLSTLHNAFACPLVLSALTWQGASLWHGCCAAGRLARC